MARKAKAAAETEVNKSQSIRDYVTANPDAGPTAVANALNEAHGWEISPAYVSTIKNKMKGPVVAGGGRSSSKSGSGLEETLLQAKQLAKQAGSFENAKAMLDLVAKLAD